MTHYIGPEVTSGNSPAIHAGINYKVATFTLPVTCSGSVSVAMMRLPGGARVTGADLRLNNANLMDAQTSVATQRIELWTGGTVESAGNGQLVQYIQSGTLGATVSTWNPNAGAVGFRATSSSHVVLVMQNPDGSGTATTIFTLALQYDCQEDPDG